MSRDQVINKTIDFVKAKLEGDSSGHDWWHIYRVWNLSKKIQEKEKGDLFIIEMAALLHDVADWKFYENEEAGLMVVRDWLIKIDLSSDIIEEIIYIIKNVSYKGAGVKDQMKTLEGKIVQDADRLDAIGAIGVARTFAFGGKFGSEMHNPEEDAKLHNSFEEYKNSKGTTINHFYEKLLLLKDRINTKTAKEIALERHNYMEVFLKQFYDEWNSLK
ncbi:MAG: HD domain-containing protein [Bacteroidales bacterium]|nr:HD domain-containing protein [Bacteroidales bacterium]